MSVADVLHEHLLQQVLQPIIAERERYARYVERLDRLVAQIEKFDRVERQLCEHGAIPEQPEDEDRFVAAGYWCTRAGCGEWFDTPTALGGHMTAHNHQDRRQTETPVTAAENPQPAYIPPAFDPPQTAGPPAHGSMLVPSGLPRRPVDHNKIRDAAFNAIDDEVKDQ